MQAGTYHPLNADHMQDRGARLPHMRGQPLPWLNDILAHRDRLEYVIRSIGEREFLTTDQILGDSLLPRVHLHLIGFRAAKQWDDPVC